MRVVTLVVICVICLCCNGQWRNPSWALLLSTVKDILRKTLVLFWMSVGSRVRHRGGGSDVQWRVLTSFHHWILACKPIGWSCTHTGCSRRSCRCAAHYQIIRRTSFSLNLCWKTHPIAFELSVVMSSSTKAWCSRWIHKTLCIKLLRSTTSSNFGYFIIEWCLIYKDTSLQGNSLSLLLLLIRKGVVDYVLSVWKRFWRLPSLVRSFGFTLVDWRNNVRVVHRS